MPSEQDINDYYQKHPELFAKRKAYEMRQVVLSKVDFKTELNALVDAGKSMDEVCAWLDANKVKYQAAQSSRTTADLPAQLVASIDTISDGKPFLMKDGERIAIASLRFVKDVPVGREDALKQAAQYLTNVSLQQSAAQEISRLRAAATIEYADASLKPAEPSVQQSAASSSTGVQ